MLGLQVGAIASARKIARSFLLVLPSCFSTLLPRVLPSTLTHILPSSLYGLVFCLLFLSSDTPSLVSLWESLRGGHIVPQCADHIFLLWFLSSMCACACAHACSPALHSTCVKVREQLFWCELFTWVVRLLQQAFHAWLPLEPSRWPPSRYYSTEIYWDFSMCEARSKSL